MKRRITAALLALAVLLLLSPGQAAAEGVYFTAANEQLMELNDENMPFYSGSVLYVSSRLFDGTELGVSYARSSSLGVAMLYSGTTDLRFDLAGQVTYDKQGNFYAGYAIERGGVVFFPLNLVCRYFGLSWSFTETDTAPLIRVKNAAVILSDAAFIDAAASLMSDRYSEYRRDASSGGPGGGTPSLPPEPPVVAAEGQKVYLTIACRSAQDTLAVLKTLGDTQATFLLTAEQMADGNLLRGLVAGGHAVALRLTAAEEETAAAEIRLARERLWRAACLWLELVWQEGEGDLSALYDRTGCVRISAQVGPPGSNQSYNNRVNTLLRSVGRYREDLAVYLGDDRDCQGVLPGLLAGLEEGRYHVSAWRLTA